MKSLKFLFATLSCTALIIGIGLPGIAETVKKSQIESSSIGIGNKQLITNNDRQKTGLVGYWKSLAYYEDGTPVEIFCNFRVDGIEDCSTKSNRGNSKAFGTWSYIDGNWTSSYPHGEYVYSIEWVSNDEIVFRKIQGAKTDFPEEQRYHRQQQTAQSQNDLLRNAKTQGQLNAVPYQNDVLIRTLRGSGY